MSAALSSAANDNRERIVHVIQGDFAIDDDQRVVMTTVLGSCVAACMHDPVARIGGMNHFLLPGEERDHSDSMKYGVQAMELLINALLKRGASRKRLQAKLFGAAHVVNNLSDIGVRNAEFAQRFLRAEQIACVSQSLGGDRARRIRFWPATGRASQRLLESTRTSVFKSEATVAVAAAPPPESGALELF